MDELTSLSRYFCTSSRNGFLAFSDQSFDNITILVAALNLDSKWESYSVWDALYLWRCWPAHFWFSYMRGRLTLEKLNTAVDEMATFAAGNAKLLTAPRQKVCEFSFPPACENRRNGLKSSFACWNSVVSDLRLFYMQLGEDGWKRVLVRNLLKQYTLLQLRMLPTMVSWFPLLKWMLCPHSCTGNEFQTCTIQTSSARLV